LPSIDLSTDLKGSVMASTESRLADGLWLAAHDTPTGKSRLGDRPLAIGLSSALLGELLFTGNITVAIGKIFPQFINAPDDSALASVVHQLKNEYRTRWPRISDSNPLDGLELREWIKYLAVDNYAHDLVTDRMSSSGAIRLKQHKRLFGGVTSRYVPANSVMSGTPASHVVTELGRRTVLDQASLTLAGLFLATGLDQQILASQPVGTRLELGRQLMVLHPMLRELLRVAEQLVGDAAMLR
jgi:hypothetical protein